MASNGSHAGNVALETLAASLGLHPLALKVALEEAFDLMQLHSNGRLALHMALARLGYSVDAQSLYSRLDAFRNLFQGAFQPLLGT